MPICEPSCTQAVLSDGTDGWPGFDQLGSLLAEAASRFSTLHVGDMVSVAQAARHVEAAFGPPWVCHYSLKASNLPAITAFLADHG